MTHSIRLMALFPLLCLVVFASSAREASADVKGEIASWGLKAIEAQQAWARSPQTRDIIVAVIDTGADVTHPDLRNALWSNPGEVGLVETDFCRSQPNPARIPACNKSTNGIDDDGNGYVDDVHGWNFAGNNHRIEDLHGHGTHVAGIIGATGDHRLKGVAPVARLMILKYYEPRLLKGDPVENTARAIEYAVKMGARIINYSAGGKKPSPREEEAIRKAQMSNVLFVAAAGNEGSNSDVFGYFPAGYQLSNILSVTAINPLKQVLPTSNYGVRSVHLAAPGEGILSTLPGGKYGVMTGTSQATAFASGVAALLMASRPGLRDPELLIQTMMRAGDNSFALKSKTQSQTHLNAARSLAMYDSGTSATGLVVENSATIDPRFVSPGFDTASENRGPATTQGKKSDDEKK
jgi:thermitase